MKRCMYCGQENSDTAAFCSACGNPLMDTPSDPMPPLEGAAAENIELNEQPMDEQEEPEIPETPAQQEPDWEEASAPETEYSYPQNNTEEQETSEGQDYASQQYYEDQSYGYAAQASAQQNYDGQAYGYDGPAGYDEQEMPYDEEEEDDFYSPALQTKARKRVKSFLFFLATLCFTIHTAASIAYLVTGGMLTNISTFTNTLTKYFGDNGVAALVVKYVNIGYGWLTAQQTTYVMAAGLILSVPGVLIMISLWKIFFGTSAKKAENSTSGYTMLRVIEILKFIVACIIILAAIAVCVSWVVAAGRAGKEMMTVIISIIVLLVVVILAVFVILYYVQLLFTVKAVRTNVRDGEDIGRIPGFLIFVGLLEAVIAGASILPMAPDDYIGLVSNGANAAWLLLISLWAVIYRIVVKVK